MASPYASPLEKGAKFARVDQGVDYQQSGAYKVIAAGTITSIGKGFAGGTGDVVYETLDTPVTVGGRSYSQVYYAEQTPLVSLNQRVSPGDPVIGGGGAELGFASGGSPAGPLVGGLGAGTQQTQAGQDFNSFVAHLYANNVMSQPNQLQQAASAAGSGVNNLATSVVPGLKTAEKIPGDIKSLVEWPFQHNRLLRFGELAAGTILAIIGLLMLTRGLTLPAATAVTSRGASAPVRAQLAQNRA